MIVEVTSGVIDTLRDEARRAAPLEACGLLVGQGERIEAAVPTANVHPDPARHFEIDPAALITALRAERSGGLRVIGYYHSHPSGPGDPSPTDRASASGDGRVWAIVADDAVRWWRDDPGRFAPVEVRAV